MKYYYKHLLIRSLYLKRQDIVLYKKNTLVDNKQFFLSNFVVVEKKFKKKQKRIFFSWLHFHNYFDNRYSKSQYSDFYNLFMIILPKLSIVDFRYYWLSVFFSPSIKTRFFYFTNKIKFFSNQRLVRQSVLFSYNTTNKNNLYSNYMRIFKGLVIKRNLNSLFFFQSVIFQIYPKLNKRSYFYRYNNYVRKFTTSIHLKLMPA